MAQTMIRVGIVGVCVGSDRHKLQVLLSLLLVLRILMCHITTWWIRLLFKNVLAQVACIMHCNASFNAFSFNQMWLSE